MRDCSDVIIDAVLTAATNVHKELGPGLLESAYEKALLIELSDSNVKAECQREIPAFYKGRDLGTGFRADVIVEDQLLLELKSVNEIAPIHVSQVITYLKLLKFKRSFILNFNNRLLKDGIKRVSL